MIKKKKPTQECREKYKWVKKMIGGKKKTRAIWLYNCNPLITDIPKFKCTEDMMN